MVREHAKPGYERPSLCDCENVRGSRVARSSPAPPTPHTSFIHRVSRVFVQVDGLCTRYDVPREQWPTAPTSLFELLVDVDAEETRIRGRPQRLAFRTAKSETWMRPSGALVCKHGNSRVLLRKIRKGASRFRSKYTVACDCVIQVPKRVNSIFAPSPSRCCVPVVDPEAGQADRPLLMP